jgi:small-conductance mechanosensitive channel
MNFLENTLFQIGPYAITVGNLLGAAALIVLLYIVYRLLSRRWLPAFFNAQKIEKKDRGKIRRTSAGAFLFLLALGLAKSLGVDPEILRQGEGAIRLSVILGILLAWQAARVCDLLLSRVLNNNLRRRQEEAQRLQQRWPAPGETVELNARTLQYLVYLFAALIFIGSFDLDRPLLAIPLSKEAPLVITAGRVIIVLLVLLGARLFSWVLTQLVLYRYYQAKEINVGAQFAINQLLRYVISVFAILFALQFIGVKMTLIWGGAAALLVGVGLGLQQTFNDFFSGLVLLFERSVEVGDVVEVDGLIGIVRRIGLRTSLVQTRDNRTVVTPNSFLVTRKVVNWSHNDNHARFHVSVNVAYGSDTELVEKLLLEVAHQHPKALKNPKPFVRFVDFGNSSLNFELHFWSRELMPIENVKSDLRFAIDKAFRRHNVTIPFPQRDLWFRNTPQAANGQGTEGASLAEER